MSVWQGLGYQIVMFMAGLESVPKSLFEAADIDGANEWQKMRKITIPLLSPTILFLSITVDHRVVPGVRLHLLLLRHHRSVQRSHDRVRDRPDRVP